MQLPEMVIQKPKAAPETATLDVTGNVLRSLGSGSRTRPALREVLLVSLHTGLQ